MTTAKKHLLFAACAAGLGLSSMARAELFDAASVRSHSGIAASPRGLETAPAAARKGLAVAVRSGGADLKREANPRQAEDYPELARNTSAERPGDRGAMVATGAANPRALEDHPELARPSAMGGGERFQVAPLK